MTAKMPLVTQHRAKLTAHPVNSQAAQHLGTAKYFILHHWQSADVFYRKCTNRIIQETPSPFYSCPMLLQHVAPSLHYT